MVGRKVGNERELLPVAPPHLNWSQTAAGTTLGFTPPPLVRSPAFLSVFLIFSALAPLWWEINVDGEFKQKRKYEPCLGGRGWKRIF